MRQAGLVDRVERFSAVVALVGLSAQLLVWPAALLRRQPFQAQAGCRHLPGFSGDVANAFTLISVFFGTGLFARSPLVDTHVVHGTDCSGRGGSEPPAKFLLDLSTLSAYSDSPCPGVAVRALVVPVLTEPRRLGRQGPSVASALESK